jgi:hypothetical protein
VTTGRDLSNEELASLQNGEILQMTDSRSGKLAGYILMDSYGAIRTPIEWWNEPGPWK